MQPIFDFVDTHAGKRPFFVWYAPYLPHQPHDSPKKYFDRYRNKPDVPTHFVPYYAAISQFDNTVGELVGYIEKKGLTENTLFVFVVDNGWTPSTRRHASAKNFSITPNKVNVPRLRTDCGRLFFFGGPTASPRPAMISSAVVSILYPRSCI